MPIFDDNVRRIMRMQNIYSPEDARLQTPDAGDSGGSGGYIGALKGGDFSSSKRYGTGENTFGTGRTGSVVDQDDTYDASTRMQQLYHPDNRIQDRYIKAIDDMPQRNNPGWGRRIAGLVGAFGNHGKENVDRILYGPYNRQLADWTNRIGALREGAAFERNSNNQMRLTANTILSDEMADRRLARQTRRDAVLAGQGDQRIAQGEARIRQGDERIAQGDAASKRADARLKIAQDIANGGKMEKDDAGNVFMRHLDGSITPVEGQYLSFEEKQNIIAKRQKDVKSTASPGSGRDRLRTEVIDDPDNPGKKIAVVINLDTNEVKRAQITGAGGVKQDVTPTVRDSETEQGKDITNKANQVKASNAQWSKYITIDKQGKVTIQRPGPLGITGPDKKMYDDIYQAIYGKPSGQAPPKTPARVGGPGPAANGQQNIPPQGWVRVTNKNTGQTARVPLNIWTRDKAARQKEGWNVVTGAQ